MVNDIPAKHFDALAIMIVMSAVRPAYYEARKLWYSGDDGIKRSKSYGGWDPDGITDLSAKEEMRWSKVCEWLDKYFERNPGTSKIQPKDQNLQNLDNLLRNLEPDLLSTLVLEVSNLPANLPSLLSPFLIVFIGPYKRFFWILVVLSCVYGGIHLATWNFAFASTTEQLLWKIACIDIMATVPIVVLCIFGLDNCFYYNTFYGLLLAIGNYALLILYAVSRIYIVAEAFIALRHVPIGVYAAVPWVQAIPHV